MRDSIDIAALAREAGVPADDRGVIRFAQLVAMDCAEICETFRPDGDADHVPVAQARATGAELGVKIRALFGCY